MDSFILIPPGPEVSGRGAGIHPGRANKHHHDYAGRYHHSAAGCPGAEGSCLATLKANISAPFRSDSKFCYMLKSHLKGAKRVSSDQPGLKKQNKRDINAAASSWPVNLSGTYRLTALWPEGEKLPLAQRSRFDSDR